MLQRDSQHEADVRQRQNWKLTFALDHVPQKIFSSSRRYLATVDKQKQKRSLMQNEMAVSILESTTPSLTVKCTRGVLLLTKAECTKHQMNTKHDMTAEKATQHVADRPSVRRPTTIDSEEARARSRQMIQQFDERDAAEQIETQVEQVLMCATVSSRTLTATFCGRALLPAYPGARCSTHMLDLFCNISC